MEDRPIQPDIAAELAELKKRSEEFIDDLRNQ